MYALTILGYCPYYLVKIKLNKGILLLLFLFLLSPTDVIAQITCDSNPKVLTPANNPHSDGFACTGTNNVEIILEDGTEILTTTNPGISITNSDGVSFTGERTLIKSDNSVGVSVLNSDNYDISLNSIETIADSQHGVLLNETNGGTIKAKNIKTGGTHSDGVRILGGTGDYVVDVKQIEIHGNGGFGIWVAPDTSNEGSSTKINVENIMLSGTNGDAPNNVQVSGIHVEAPGNVDIQSTGKISTTANNVQGILVNHLNPGNSVSGTVNIQVNDLETQGDFAHGVYVFSKGIELPKQIETEINISVFGSLLTNDATSQGIVVESARSDITLTIGSEGTVRTTNTDSGTFALFLAGTLNVGENKSAVINNQGLVFGNIFTEGCARYFNSGTTITQESITISSTDCPNGTNAGFYNTGIVNIGGKDVIKTTMFTGNYIQEENGQFIIDVDWPENTIDLLTITGSANLSGNLVVNSVGFPDLSSFEFQRDVDFAGTVISSQTFLTATEGITGTLQYNEGSTLLLANEVTKSGDNTELALTYALGDGLSLLNRNQTNVFWGLNSSRSESDEISDVFLDLFTEVNLPELQKILDSLGNEIAGAIIRSEIRNIEQSGHPMEYCDQNSKEKSGVSDQDLTAECKFFTAKFLSGSHSGNFEQREHKDKLLEGLFRIPLVENIGDGQIQLLGKISKTQINLTDFAKSDGHSGTLGLGYYQESNIGTLSLLAQIGLGSYEITRNLQVLNQMLTASGTLKSRSAAISAGISNSFDMGLGALNWYVQAGYYGVNSKPYSESGGEDFSLVVDKTSNKGFVLNPRFKFVGKNWNIGNLDIAPLVGGGITHRPNPEVEFMSKFSARGDKILSTTVLPKTEFNYFLGTDILRPDNNLKGTIGYSGYITEGESLSGEMISGQLTILF